MPPFTRAPFLSPTKMQGRHKVLQRRWRDRRLGPVRIDFNRLRGVDTLISDPPRSIGSDFQISVGSIRRLISLRPAECWVLDCVLRLWDTRGRTRWSALRLKRLNWSVASIRSRNNFDRLWPRFRLCEVAREAALRAWLDESVTPWLSVRPGCSQEVLVAVAVEH